MTFAWARFVTLPNTMRAKKKPIEQITPEALGVDVTPQLVTVQVTWRKGWLLGAGRDHAPCRSGHKKQISNWDLTSVFCSNDRPVSNRIPHLPGCLMCVQVNEPPKRKTGTKVNSVAELVEKLKNEAKVI